MPEPETKAEAKAESPAEVKVDPIAAARRTIEEEVETRRARCVARVRAVLEEERCAIATRVASETDQNGYLVQRALWQVVPIA